MPDARIRPDAPRISIVIPAKNEARNLELILPRLPEAHEVILVDGRSVDGTVDVARATVPEIRVIQQTRRGKGNALVCGFAAATGDIIVMFDADCSADPAEIPRFVETLLAGADFAKGSRFTPGGGSLDITPLRAAGNRILIILANIIFGTNYTDLCYGYNAFWSDILEQLDLPPSGALSSHECRPMSWGDGFEIETLINCRIAAEGMVVSEVPSKEQLRVHGFSNLNAIADGWRVLKTIEIERRRAARSKSAHSGAVSALRPAARKQASWPSVGVQAGTGVTHDRS